MKFSRSQSLPLLLYVLAMVIGCVVAQNFHARRAERAVYTDAFRVSAPPLGEPGSDISIEFQSYRSGHHDVLEIGNLRIATAITSNSYGSSGSGNFSSRVPDPSDPKSHNTFNTQLAHIPIVITNCEVTLGDVVYSVLDPRQLVVIDRAAHVVRQASLAE